MSSIVDKSSNESHVLEDLSFAGMGQEILLVQVEPHRSIGQRQVENGALAKSNNVTAHQGRYADMWAEAIGSGRAQGLTRRGKS